MMQRYLFRSRVHLRKSSSIILIWRVTFASNMDSGANSWSDDNISYGSRWKISIIMFCRNNSFPITCSLGVSVFLPSRITLNVSVSSQLVHTCWFGLEAPCTRMCDYHRLFDAIKDRGEIMAFLETNPSV
ncbi:hypothetical protein EV421DRAFT_967683 [Armillaria borealis]|uniref:Uncharacterized protein n=1 Tax=Armillaria borealis TaxID=47425 RepID=A0AA39MKS3_9AGAR|nr:hypothetical protein EV421DRAFT_967683 [Armillaria borealis]